MLDTPPPLERLLAHIDATGEHHRWAGSIDPRTGTGQFRINGKLRSAQRAAWELQVGPLPSGVRVRACLTDRRCVRIEHLALEPSRRRIVATADSLDGLAQHLSLSAAFPLYLAALERRGRRENTLAVYRSIFRRWLEPALGELPLGELRSSASAVIDDMTSTLPDSAAVARSIVNGLSQWANDEGL